MSDRKMKQTTHVARKTHRCVCGEKFLAGTSYDLVVFVDNGKFKRTKTADHIHKGTQMPLFVAKAPMLQADPDSCKPPKKLA